jgi:DNA processing protein
MSQILLPSNALYPARLREVRPAVKALYVRGELRLSDWHGVAIIGARHPHNPEAKLRAERIARAVVGLGYSVISGMALGCDGWAQAAAIEAGGRTIAVLAGDVETAAEGTRWLGPEIARHGALVSERPPSHQLTAADFVPRDRITTGAALAVIVIDADINGGTMKSVQWAEQQGRPVLAVPGSPGCDMLIKCGRARAIATPQQLEAQLQCAAQ